MTTSPLQQTLVQVRLMYRYALDEDKLDDGARKALTAVQSVLTAPDDSVPEASTIDFDKLMSAHAALARVIAPATPSSLEATEPLPGFFGSLRNPPLIGWMILIGLFSLVGFVVARLLHTFIPSVSNNLEWLNVIEWAFAAALGAVFYVLFTAHSYVKDRTFDLRYNSVYVIRFVLGVLAGIILAIVTSSYLSGTSDQLKKLTPSIIALLGGFSTEAVYQILQRMVDILVAAVKGDGSDAAKTKAEQTAQMEFLNLAEDPEVLPDLKVKLIAAAKKVGA
ncbi:MAG: hypothetical protein ACLPXT_14380 [Terracidiphilus sp.]